MENGHKSRKMKSIFPDLSEKIMACMQYDILVFSLKTSGLFWLHLLKLQATDFLQTGFEEDPVSDLNNYLITINTHYTSIIDLS